MARYLSQGWFDEVNEAARRSAALRGSTAGVSLTLQQVVTDTPEGELRYWLRVEDGSLEASLGTAGGVDATADATVTQSYETATAILRGELSTEEAFLGGRIRLRGDIGLLLRHRSVLDHLGATFADVHRRTEYA
ncbi:MAG TPA: SCP2 sterol-binding domain-containing protein [Acidimicrobiales bacterium]|nr:SCP2 sterol-binding domain-containing protein [Acidimicrobiales bacterium]